MKKKYIVPSIESFEISTLSMLCLSKGNDEGDGVAEAKKFWGNPIWEEDAEEEETPSF